MAYPGTASLAGKRRLVRKQDSLSEPPRKSPHDDAAIDSATRRPLASRRHHVATAIRDAGLKDISTETVASSAAGVSGGLCYENVPIEDATTPGGKMAGERPREHSTTPMFVLSRASCQTVKSECIGVSKRDSGCHTTAISSAHNYTTDDVTRGYHGHPKADCLDPYDLSPIMRSLSMECFNGSQQCGWRQVARSDSMPESVPVDDYGVTSVRNLRRGAICYDDSESVDLMAGLNLCT